MMQSLWQKLFCKSLECKNASSYALVSLKGGRSVQEDRILYCHAHAKHFFLLADGLGGHAGGNIAASTLKNIARKLFLCSTTQEHEALFREIVHQTYVQLREHASSPERMARTTVVMAIIDENSMVYWGHLGDCRLYILSQSGQIQHRTYDHTPVMLAVRSGELTEEEARTHPNRSLLYRCLGGEKENTLTYGQSAMPLAKGDMVVLCSDGFWEGIPIDALGGLPLRQPSLQGELLALARKAVALGGLKADNTSAIVYRQG